jgi:hypothetical protein
MYLNWQGLSALTYHEIPCPILFAFSAERVGDHEPDGAQAPAGRTAEPALSEVERCLQIITARGAQ